MRPFNSECDPAYEYLTAVHNFLIFISLELSASLPLSAFFALSSHFRNFPLSISQTLMPKPVSFPLSSHKISQPLPQLRIFFRNPSIDLESAARFFRGHAWSTLGVHLKADFLTPPFQIMTFEPSADHKTFPSHESSPSGVAGNRLLWPSGLGSHGETHYCSHMPGYMRWWNHVSSIF